MSMREFTDRAGRRWTVWAVHPSSSDRRNGAPDLREPPRVERRHRDIGLPRLRPEYAQGWLACETLGEKRRVAPIPADWEELPDHALAALCEAAALARPGRRLAE